MNNQKRTNSYLSSSFDLSDAGMNNSPINYSNYLSAKTDVKYSARYQFSDVTKRFQNDVRQFLFTVSTVNNDMIIEQAEVFSESVVAQGYFENSFLNNVTRARSAVSIIRDTYIYSYIKSLYLAHSRINLGRSGLFGSNNNLCFHGHALLHDLIIEGQMKSFSTNNQTLCLEIEAKEDVIENLKTFEIWDEIFNTDRQRVFNYEYEIVLGYFKDKVNKISVTSIGQTLCNEVYSIPISPLGNMCLSGNCNQLLYVEDSSVCSDLLSYYWGKANLVRALEIPPIDADDEIYDTIPTESYDRYGVCYEIESITGFNPYGVPRTAYDLSNSSSRSSGRIPDVPNNSSQRSPNSRLGSRRANNSNNSQNRMASVVKRVVSLGGDAVKIVKNADNILSSEQLSTVSAIVSGLTGKDITAKQLKWAIGKSVRSVFEKHKIPVSIEMDGDVSEYDSFYIEPSANGAVLVGRQKYISDK